MSSAWPMAPLGEVLRHRKEFVPINDLETYKRCRVQLHANGIVLRDQVSGAEIKTKQQQVCKAGEFLVAEIDAKLGGYGIVPTALEGAIVSSHYFLFGISEQKLDRSFLGYFIRTPAFFEQVAAQGSTNYAAIRPSHVLEYTMPLPPLAEQRRLVKRIDALAAKIKEGKKLQDEVQRHTENLGYSLLNKVYEALFSKYGVAPLAECCSGITDGTHLTPSFMPEGVKFIFVGNVSSGTLHFDGCKYVDPSYYATVATSRRPKPGDVLYSAVGATLGIPAVVDRDDNFCFQRHIAILKPDQVRLDSRYLWYMLRSGTLFDKAWASITGTAAANSAAESH